MLRCIFFSVIGLLVLAGCAGTTPPRERQARFIESEYAPYASQGNGTLVGQAFLKTRGGDVKYAAGNEIILNPVTSYSTEWFDVAIRQGQDIAEGDARVQPFTRSTFADGEGRFEFNNPGF